MHRIATRKPSVRPFFCLSVCLSNARIVTNERKFCPHCYTTWKIIHPSFLTRRMVEGRSPLFEIWVKLTLLEQKSYFQSIIARSTSAITPSKRSSINTNRKPNVVEDRPNNVCKISSSTNIWRKLTHAAVAWSLCDS